MEYNYILICKIELDVNSDSQYDKGVIRIEKFIYGLIFCIVISILTSIYGYINYTEDMAYNIMQLRCIKAIFIDEFITLLLFVPFLK